MPRGSVRLLKVCLHQQGLYFFLTSLAQHTSSCAYASFLGKLSWPKFLQECDISLPSYNRSLVDKLFACGSYSDGRGAVKPSTRFFPHRQRLVLPAREDRELGTAQRVALNGMQKFGFVAKKKIFSYLICSIYRSISCKQKWIRIL